MRLNPVEHWLNCLASEWLKAPAGMEDMDFDQPVGAPALFAPDTVTWRVMANPVALLVGGIAGVLLELAEPRVREGVWRHTSFRADPAGRIRRTGYAAMATVYAPAEQARRLIVRVNAMHARIAGETRTGEPYRADDPDLLGWVYATAQFGFSEAYHRFVHRLSNRERDAFYAEGAPVAALWGAASAPRSAAELNALFQRTRPRLERSDTVTEFLAILERAPLLPPILKPLQRLAIAGAIDILPDEVRDLLGLERRFGAGALKLIGAASLLLNFPDAPPERARRRVRGKN